MPGIKIRTFQKGTAHLIFSPEWLRKINLALAEFYGDVLAETDENKPEKKRASTAVAKNLAFYWTPAKVTEQIIAQIKRDRSLADDLRVLEPSCGEGHMLDVLRQHRPNARIAGVEAHHERAMTAKAKGYRVRVGNFLEVPAQPDFDLVLMNQRGDRPPCRRAGELRSSCAAL